MEEYHYVDDELFARQFTSQNNKLSKRMIENKLKQKGVDKTYIENASEMRSSQQEFDLCLEQARKYVKSKDMTKENAVQKLYASLARKGFSFDDIKKSVSAVTRNLGVEDIEDFYE